MKFQVHFAGKLQNAEMYMNERMVQVKEGSSGKVFQRFTTLDIVLMAMLAAANAVMTVFLSPVNQALNGLGVRSSPQRLPVCI